ncbi:flagellar hook-basal body complex protein FliE [Paracoccus caeni]|uniref:Flagellar hook-basal body complex protein FliE n=1 Tax=Paracoccus caeni TaxID=657651 RepID=A0A934SL45_9RHOB|nr:flagellar hook-basal body complex protein FliE [Paracoccus caeni]MBK4216388.1 flagellar hook-basal body complex protein FliE [Paracoccus caeni]
MISSTTAADAYNAARTSVQPGAGAIERVSNAAEDFARQMSQVDNAATGAMNGQVETQQLVQTITEAQLAMETVVAIRDKVVEAYQEILRMPV